VTIAKKSPAVLVLSQPDDRYFRGLTGRYEYDLHFRLYREGEKTYLLRSMENSGSGRSCSAELELEPGKYIICIKVTASRYGESKTVQEVIKENQSERRDKLLDVGRSFDLIHSKGNLREMEKELLENEKKEKKADKKAEIIEKRKQKKVERERAKKKKQRIQEEKERRLEEKKAERKKKKALEIAKDGKASDGANTSPKTEETTTLPETKAEPNSAEAQAEVKSVEPASGAPKPDVSRSRPLSSHKRGPSASGPLKTETSSSSGSSLGMPTPERTPETERTVQEGTVTVEEGASAKPEATTEAKSTDTKDEAAPAENTPKDMKEIIAELKDGVGELEKLEDAEKPAEGESDVSDVSEPDDDDFDWDSEIDQVESDEDSDSGDDDKDMLFADDPWRAICVVGLKVCHIDAGAEISVKRTA
jgi:hypothetical protein